MMLRIGMGMAVTQGNAPAAGGSPPPDTTAPAAVDDLAIVTGANGSVTLGWTVPDDEVEAHPAKFSVKRAAAAITNDAQWDAATAVATDVAETQNTGVEVERVYAGLPDGKWYFGVRYQDATGNEAGVSNSPIADLEPPLPIVDLFKAVDFPGGCELVWTVPEEPTGGSPTSFEVRRNADGFTSEADWNAAFSFGVFPSGGWDSEQTFEATDMEPLDAFVFVVRTRDAAGNLSDFSNQITVTIT